MALLNIVTAFYSRVSIPDEIAVVGVHGGWDVLHFGQESPGRAVVALLRNLERC